MALYLISAKSFKSLSSLYELRTKYWITTRNWDKRKFVLVSGTTYSLYATQRSLETGAKLAYIETVCSFCCHLTARTRTICDKMHDRNLTVKIKATVHSVWYESHCRQVKGLMYTKSISNELVLIELTLWSWALLEKSLVVWALDSSQHFMEPVGSIVNSQEFSTCPYPEPDQSTPSHLYKIHPNIIQSPTSWSS
jgi:hypothetical protein